MGFNRKVEFINVLGVDLSLGLVIPESLVSVIELANDLSSTLMIAASSSLKCFRWYNVNNAPSVGLLPEQSAAGGGRSLLKELIIPFLMLSDADFIKGLPGCLAFQKLSMLALLLLNLLILKLPFKLEV